jgi:hypothetical protein
MPSNENSDFTGINVFFDVSSIGEVIAGLIKSWSSKCVEIDG